MPEIKTIDITPNPMPLSFILSLYKNLPEKEKTTFVQLAIKPEDRQLVEDSIENMKDAENLEKIVKKGKALYVKHARINYRSVGTAWTDLADHACELLLTLANYDLKETQTIMAMHLNQNKNE